MAKLFPALLLWAALAPAQVVDGTVVDSVTGAGIPKIGVNFEQITGSPVHLYQARTDDQGHYHFDNIQDGVYRIQYATNDYFWIAEATDTQQFQIAAGGDPLKLIAHMTPMPRLSGRVLDAQGTPVPGASVDLDQVGLALRIDTDAAGKFDQPWRPGTYILSAVPPPSLKPPDPEPETHQPLGWTRTYYPGVTAAEAAARIVVTIGIDVLDLQIKLRAVPVHAIRGTILKPDGSPLPRVAMQLQYGTMDPALKTESKADATFEFPAVPDGQWRFSGEIELGGQTLRAQQWIAMSGHDLEDVKVRLVAPFPVSGKVVFEKPDGTPAPKPSSVLLMSSRREHPEVFPDSVSARPDADGNFTFPHVYPGNYRLDASPPSPYYLDAVRLGEVELLVPEMELSPGAPPITVRYKADGGAVRGSVEKCDSGRVLLVPADSALRAAFFRVALCDSHNRYEFAAIRPGEYYVVAFAGLTPPGFTPSLDDSLLNQGAHITVRAKETSSADLRALVPPN